MTTHDTPRRRTGQAPKPQAQPEPHRSGAARDAAGLAHAATQPAASLWDTPVAPEPVLPDSEPVSAIRDSLYELIPLGALEVDLIGTAEFIRLQGVKQLGFVQRVWPGATHTRFEHSLGVYYLMLRALRAVRAQSPAAMSADATDLRTLLAAALLHDIGHYPFSHAIEELGYPIMPHERVGRNIIEAGGVAAALKRHGLSPVRVADLVDPPRDRALPASDTLLIRLLSGPLDVDKLDYLPRDARACNVPYGGVDVTRLLGSLRVLETPTGPRLGVSDKGISPLNSLLHARQEMFDNVYWHHTNRAMMAMLLRAVQEALLASELTPEDLAGHDDASLLALLASERMPPATRALVEALRMRRPYKVLIEVSARAGRIFNQLDALFWDQGKRRRVEIALAEALETALAVPVAPQDVLVDIPKPEKWEMDVQVRFDQPPLGMAPLMTWTEATGLRGSDLGIYEQHQRRIRLVAREGVRDAAGIRVRDVLLPMLERVPAM
ncbi:MAG TPA: HD domain-containing protein [Ktedonobacterales bacterium]|nr:HD domain-containing protein [Ktedonobacterales bacterium]